MSQEFTPVGTLLFFTVFHLMSFGGGEKKKNQSPFHDLVYLFLRSVWTFKEPVKWFFTLNKHLKWNVKGSMSGLPEKCYSLGRHDVRQLVRWNFCTTRRLPLSRDHEYLINNGKLCVMPSVSETFSDWAWVTDDFPTRSSLCWHLLDNNRRMCLGVWVGGKALFVRPL